VSKKLLLIGLVVVFAFGAIFATACGGDDEAAKQTMRDALTVVEADIDALTTQFTAGGTGADVKAALTGVQPDWQAVIDACANVKDADAAKAQQVWDDVQAAATALPDDAGLAELAVLLGPVQAVQAFVDELRGLVGTDETAAE